MLKIATVVLAFALLVTGLLAWWPTGDDAAPVQESRRVGGYVPAVIDPPKPELGVLAPVSSSVAPPSSSSQAPPASKFTATAGPGCGGFKGVGMYRDGKKGWVDHGEGCDSFVSIPMSGDARKDDTSAFGLWTFTVTGSSCALSVYVPSGSLEQVGGDPTSYRVYDGAEPSGAPAGSFEVAQVDQRGTWVGAGTYRVTSGKLAVQLLTRGQDWNGSGPTYAHHAAAPIKADCVA